MWGEASRGHASREGRVVGGGRGRRRAGRGCGGRREGERPAGQAVLAHGVRADDGVGTAWAAASGPQLAWGPLLPSAQLT